MEVYNGGGSGDNSGGSGDNSRSDSDQNYQNSPGSSSRYSNQSSEHWINAGGHEYIEYILYVVSITT